MNEFELLVIVTVIQLKKIVKNPVNAHLYGHMHGHVMRVGAS